MKQLLSRPYFYPAHSARAAACLVLLALLPLSVGTMRGQSGSNPIPPGKDLSEIRSLQNPRWSNSDLDNNPNMSMDQKQLKALNELRKKELNADTEKLLALATELKSDMDKTGKDTLSLDVVRKAEAIEKLAKSVKQKMKATIGG